VEARIDSGQSLLVMAGGTQVSVPNPRPKICDTDPKANEVCKITGNLDLNLQITTVIRLKTLNPGLSFGSLENMNVDIAKSSFGTKLTIAANPIRYMGYIKYQGMPNFNETYKNPAGDFIAGLWLFSLSDQSRSPFGKCNSAGAAFVETNAEDSNAPTWNAQFKSLDMQTASSHFEPDGVTPFKGIYSARLSAALVKCAWGVDATKAVNAAQVQIVSNSGDSSVASISSSYQNGWLKLDARNYEYSNPIIRVRFPDSVSTKVLPTSITCAKGKITKKVIALKPTCPAGYKKK